MTTRKVLEVLGRSEGGIAGHVAGLTEGFRDEEASRSPSPDPRGYRSGCRDGSSP